MSGIATYSFKSMNREVNSGLLKETRMAGETDIFFCETGAAIVVDDKMIGIIWVNDLYDKF